MNYEEFTALASRSKEIWKAFKESFEDPRTKDYLKHSHPVLSCPLGQCALEATDYHSVALWSPKSLVHGRASSSLIHHVQEHERLKKELEGRRNKDEGLKKELTKAKAWIDEFDPQRLDFEEHRLEARFPSLKIDIIQKIKQSPLVDHGRIGREMVCIRVVLLVS
ncbi:MAG: hypothetical protein WCJ71_08740 [Candidatus Omnitrophota bacterium]